MKRVLDVGNCGPDFSAIRQLVEGNFDAKVDQAHQAEDAINLLDQHTYALVFVWI